MENSKRYLAGVYIQLIQLIQLTIYQPLRLCGILWAHFGETRSVTVNILEAISYPVQPLPACWRPLGSAETLSSTRRELVVEDMFYLHVQMANPPWKEINTLFPCGRGFPPKVCIVTLHLVKSLPQLHGTFFPYCKFVSLDLS